MLLPLAFFLPDFRWIVSQLLPRTLSFFVGFCLPVHVAPLFSRHESALYLIRFDATPHTLSFFLSLGNIDTSHSFDAYTIFTKELIRFPGYHFDHSRKNTSPFIQITFLKLLLTKPWSPHAVPPKRDLRPVEEADCPCASRRFCCHFWLLRRRFYDTGRRC